MIKKIAIALLLLINTHQACSMDIKAYDSFKYKENPWGLFLGKLDKFVQRSSVKKINSTCKRIGKELSLLDEHPFIKDVLSGKQDLESKYNSTTALILACMYNRIPAIVGLLKAGANLEEQDGWGISPFNGLTMASPKKSNVFVLREIFNNGSFISKMMVVESVLKKICIDYNCIEDITFLIRQLYIKIQINDLLAEVFLWRSDCIKACELAAIEEKNENSCLAHIMSMSQCQKTEVNKGLFLEGKEPYQNELFSWNC